MLMPNTKYFSAFFIDKTTHAGKRMCARSAATRVTNLDITFDNKYFNSAVQYNRSLSWLML